jgi:5-methylcytosine-specific restriction enzyme subunit McrC
VITVEISETGPGVSYPVSHEQGVLLARSGVVNAVPSPYRPGWWQISSAGKVGAARIGDVAVSIRPKVMIARLIFLAGYAQYGLAWLTEDVLADSADDLVPAMAEALWRQVARAIRQGLLPGYVAVEESSPVLRGRMRESEQLRRHHGLPLPLEIRHDEFTVDIAENQILRTACERMLAVPGIRGRSALMLRRLLRDFTDVTPLARRDPVPAWQATRLNARYHSALRLGELVLKATSFDHGPGDIAVNGFLLDMPQLFEDFVTKALGAALTGRYGGRIYPQDWNQFDESGRVRLKPDLVWKVGERPVAVVDAKYKAESPAGYPNADLYQLLAYCTVLGLRHGHLVYAKGDAEPARHTVRRAGIEIRCNALDLAVDPPTLISQVSNMADQIARCSAYGDDSRKVERLTVGTNDESMLAQ